MSEEPDGAPDTSLSSGRGGEEHPAVDTIERVLEIVELAAAVLFVLLFAIGVVDLALRIGRATLSGRITDPEVVIGFIDTGLLLFIIVEVYETVVAYTRGSETREIVGLVVYTGIIAMVRKVIIFRTSVYETTTDALFVAVAYTLILIGLAIILLVERRLGPTSGLTDNSGASDD